MSFQHATGTDTDGGTIGFGPRSRKHKATSAFPRKVSAKTPAGSKRKKAAIDEDEDDGSGEHPGFLFPKTSRTGKKQRVVREESFGLTSRVSGDESGEGDLDREVNARPVGLRRTTRATSGTSAPTMNLAVPVVRKAGRPRTRPTTEEDDLEEVNEEEVEAEIVRSPAKRVRQSPAKKRAK